MTIFDSPLWPSLRPFAHYSEERGNVDLLGLTDELRAIALDVVVHCVACGNRIRCFRVRAKSKRARTAGMPEERRLFYAATCESSVNSGCSRSRAAKAHKVHVRSVLGAAPRAVEVIRMIDDSMKFAPAACRKALLAARELLEVK